MNIVCGKSGAQFEVTKGDEDFYKMMNVPIPTLSPEERQRRRLAWRNERVLHKRKCSGTGRTIIGMYTQDTIFPVYDHSGIASIVIIASDALIRSTADMLWNASFVINV